MRIDPLEERQLLSVSPAQVDDSLVNYRVDDFQTTMAAQSIAVDNDGDFVVVWTGYDDLYETNPITGEPVIDPITGLPMPIIDPATGDPMTDANVYARYFTDETQRLTLPDEVGEDNLMGSYGKFALSYGGNEIQKLEITATYEPYFDTMFQETISGTIGLGFDLDGNGEIDPTETTTIIFNEVPPLGGSPSEHLRNNAEMIQTALQGLGGELNDVDVQAVSPREYLINFGDAAQGKDLPQITVENANFTSGFLPAVEVSTVREPIELGEIFVSPNNPALTASWIEMAFLRTGENFLMGPVDFPPPNRLPPTVGDPVEGPYELPLEMRTGVPQVSVMPLSATRFDITFVDNSGKMDHPPLVITAVEDDFGNSLIDSPQLDVMTVKEPSPEFRVNPTEVSNPFAPMPEVHDQIRPAVAMDADGDFVIVWEGEVSNFDVFGSVTDIFARRFSPVGGVDANDVSFIVDMDANGVEETTIRGVRPVEIPPETELTRLDDFTFRVNTTTTNAQFQPAVAMDDAGNFTIAWAGAGQDMSFFNGITAQRFNRHGVALGNEILVNTEDTSIHFEPAVALSHDGNILITWGTTDDPNFVIPPPLGPGTYLVGVEAAVYDPDGQVLLPQFGVAGGGSPAAAWDMDHHFVITYDVLTETDNFGRVTVGALGQMYELFDVAGAVSGNVIREEFHVNSADLTTGRTPYWPLWQGDTQPAIDADGDLVIAYEGYGPDVSERVSAFSQDQMMDAIAKEINLQNNADLLPLFDPQWDFIPVEYFLPSTDRNGDLLVVDPDGVIDEILIRAENWFATPEQMGRLRAILERSVGLLRGDAYGALFSRFDADPVNGFYDLLYSDSVANAFRDGRNARYILTLDDTVAGGAFLLRLTHPSLTGFQDIVVTVVTDPNNANFLDVDATADAIEAALEGAAFTGVNWPEPWYYGPIEVRIINDPTSGFGFFIDELSAREGTAWEIPGGFFGPADPNDYIFEILFQGEVHDQAMFTYVRDSALTMPARDEIQILNFSPFGPPPSIGQFQLSAGGNTTQPITFNSNDLFATAAAILNAIVNDLGFDGATIAVPFGGPPYQFEITFADNSGGVDQPPLQGQPVGAFDDVPPPLAASIASFAIQQGGPAGEAPWPDIVEHTTGDEGTWQTAVSIGMEPDGDFVMAWTQFERFTDTFTANNTIYFRQFDESTDTAGPLVADLIAPDGTHTDEGGRFPTTTGLQHLVVSFDEEMMVVPDVDAQLAAQGLTRDDVSEAVLQQLELQYSSSVTNPENYSLLSGQLPIGGSIVDVQFGMSMAAELAEEYGLDSLPSNRWEAVITVDANEYAAGLQPLPMGLYTLEVHRPVIASATQAGQSGVRDKSGNPLGHNGFLPGGADFVRSFNVVIGDGPVMPGDPNDGSIDVPVNTTEVARQDSPATAIDATGDYVIVWASYGQGIDSLSQSDIFAQRFDRRGEAVGPEFVVNTYRDGTQLDPDVAMDEAGNFVVTWSGEGPVDFSGVFARRFDRFGRARGDQFRVNDVRQQEQSLPSVALDGDGNFVIAFTTDRQDTNSAEVYARLYGAGGSPISNEFRVNSTTAGRQMKPDVARDVDGDFAVVWQSEGQDGNEWGIYGQRFNAVGQRRGGEFRSNQYTTDQQIDPQISMSDDGRFVVAWSSFGQDRADTYGVYARRYNANGTASSEFRVNQTVVSWQETPAVGMDKNGNFSIVWTSYGFDDEDAADYGIYGRMYMADGSDFRTDPSEPALGEFRINATTAGHQVEPAVGRSTINGDYIVAWTGPDLDRTGIYSRLLDPPVKTVVDPGTNPNPTTLDLVGTGGNDLFEFIGAADPGSWQVRLNGVMQGVASSLESVSFDGVGGSDTVYLTATGEDEVVQLYPDHGSLVGAEYTVTFENVEHSHVEGGGGTDQVTMHDAAGPDTLTAKQDEVTLLGSSVDYTVSGFEVVVAQATPGDGDQADLFDSFGNDVLISQPTNSQLAGDGYQFQVENFDNVHAYANAGGTDTAKLFDSSGNDLFTADGTESSLSGDGFTSTVSFFESVHVYATGGGFDMVAFSDSIGDDTFYGDPTESVFSGDGFDYHVHYFDSVVATASRGGLDTAILQGSDGNDQFAASPDYGVLSGNGYSNRVDQFESVTAYAGQGEDTAALFGSSENDYFLATDQFGALYGNGYYNRAEGFDLVEATAGDGTDTAKLFDSPGDDTFVATSSESSLFGSGFENRATGFDSVYAYGASGGQDRAELYDAAIEGGVGEMPIDQLAKIAWLYQFEQMSNDDQPVDEQAIDNVLTAYWPE